MSNYESTAKYRPLKSIGNGSGPSLPSGLADKASFASSAGAGRIIFTVMFYTVVAAMGAVAVTSFGIALTAYNTGNDLVSRTDGIQRDLDGNVTYITNTFTTLGVDIHTIYDVLNMTNPESPGASLIQDVQDLGTQLNSTVLQIEALSTCCANSTQQIDTITNLSSQVNATILQVETLTTCCSNSTQQIETLITSILTLNMNVSDLASCCYNSSSSSSNPQFDDHLFTINYINGHHTSKNIDLLAGAGIQIGTNDTLSSITITNTGLLSLYATPGTGITAQTLDGHVTVTGTGVVQISGITAGIAGNIQINGIGVTITPNGNDSSITIDASTLVTDITNLQTMDMLQQGEINLLQSTVANLQIQLNDIQQMQTMLYALFNGTSLEVDGVNATLASLVMDLTTAQSDIASLQAQLANVTSGSIPAGTITPWSGAALVLPAGYLLCDGTQYDILDYPDLFNVVGTMYCPGPCTVGMFAVPDLTGKIPAGRGGTAFNMPIGTVVGAETHTLTTAQMPAHNHAGTEPGGNHNHGGLALENSVSILLNNGAVGVAEPFGSNFCTNQGLPINCPSFQGDGFPDDTDYDVANSGYTHAHTITNSGDHTHNIYTDGSGNAHNNIQPSMVLQYIIKT